MQNVPTQRIGPYTTGEAPEPIDVTIKDYDGNVVDLTDFTPTVRIVSVDETISGIGEGTASVPSPSSGVVRYTWAAADFANAGMYRLQVWVVHSSGRKYASDVFEYFVQTVTTAP